MAALALGLAALAQGCSAMSGARVEDCRKLAQTLQADNSRLKDVALRLKNQNQDLTQRAVADARRLKQLDEDNARLERSIAGYQDDREELSAAFDRITRQVRSAALGEPVPTAVLESIRGAVEDHPEHRFEPDGAVLVFEADRLFEPGRDELTPEGRARLEKLAAALAAPGAARLPLRVVGLGAASAERRASTADEPAPAARLGLARAERIRAELGRDGRVDPARVGVAGAETPAGSGVDRRIEIHLGGDPAVAAP